MRDNPIHPDLRAAVRFMPQIPVIAPTLWFLRWLTPLFLRSRPTPGVRTEARIANGVPVRMHRPDGLQANSPALLWIHGGGHVLGTAGMDDAACARYARDLGLLVVAPDYRLAPEHPFPADLDDCHAALHWLHASATDLGIDPARIVVGGASAGGGLAAALAQRLHDEGRIRPAFQLLIYPMLDDRTALREDIDQAGFRFWHQRSNRYAWRAYLGRAPGSADLPAYAAPGRRTDLGGLPPAWVGVGTLDLFLDEDRDYVRRLQAAGVEVTAFESGGAYHGFDLWAPRSPPAQAFHGSQLAAIRRALSC